jgi:hypothetical protein
VKKDTELTVNYDILYPRQWKSPIFNPSRSFWDDSYGIQLDTHPAGKIIVFGLPKSGNVWLKSLLVDYFGLPPVEPLLDVGKPGVGITHRPFDANIGNRADFLHGVCIVRDLRDVVASFYAYTQTERFRSARPEFHYDDINSFYYDWFLSRSVPAHRILVHSEQYASLGVPIIRYEALRKSGVREIERLLMRWGLIPHIELIEKAVAANDIERLRKTGKLLEKVISAEHFRRGEVGGYRASLPAEVIQDIEFRFGRVLRRWGYLHAEES